MPELIKLLSTKSMMRYLPPKGTAGFARSLVSGESRVPLPPARTIPKTRMRMCGQTHSSREAEAVQARAARTVTVLTQRRFRKGEGLREGAFSNGGGSKATGRDTRG